MRIEQLRKMDMNLLVGFTALAEELHISRAAERLYLSQPATSRILQRLRRTFGDDLMVRTGGGYELTPLGQRLFNELSGMLPRLDRLISGTDFDPATEKAHFKIALTDNAAAVLVPPLCRNVLPSSKNVTLHFQAWSDHAYDDLLHGRTDLVMNADDGHAPPVCHTQSVYEDRFVCVVSADSPHTGRMSMEEYLGMEHICVSVLSGIQTIPQNRLMRIGAERRCVLRVPYFTTAIASVAGTNFVATIPEKLAVKEKRNPSIRILEPPEELSGFKYLMIWHPRVHNDVAHKWLRSAITDIGTHVML